MGELSRRVGAVTGLLHCPGFIRMKEDSSPATNLNPKGGTP